MLKVSNFLWIRTAQKCMENNALRGFSDSSFENVLTRHICAKYMLFPTYTLLVFCAQSPYYTTHLAVFSEYLKMTLVCQKVIIHQYATYLANIITPYTVTHPKETSIPLTNTLPSSTCSYGDRAFASAASILWHILSDRLTAETDTSSFMKSLKTYLFHHSGKKVLVGCIESLLDYYVLYKCILLLLLALYCANSFICLRIP